MKVFGLRAGDRAKSRPRVLVCDGFGSHESLEIFQYCMSNNTTLCRLYSHTSHKLQPCDIEVFAPLKTAYRDNVERSDRGGVNTIGKQHFTSLYSPARNAAFTKRNILAGWSKGGLFRFNPQRVLRDMEKPFLALTEAAGMPNNNAEQDPVPPAVTSPITRVTPVSSASYAALQDTIIRTGTYGLDEVEKHKFERHVDKLAKAAQTFLARNTLREEHIGSLLKTNNEAKA